MAATLYEPDLTVIDDVFEQGLAVAVEDGGIIAVGPRADMKRRFSDAAAVDWSGMALLPGTVNAHNHSFQSLLRGVAADEPFLVWRDQALYRYTPLLDADTLYAGALLAFGEMLRYGVTTVADFFYVHGDGTEYDEAVIRAANDLGIRFVFARTLYDWTGAPPAYRESVADAVARTRELAIRYQGHPMISVHPAPHSPHAASPDMIQAGHRLARELATPYHIHVAEEMFEVSDILKQYGTRPVHYLDRLGVLDESMIAVHLVWLLKSHCWALAARGSRTARRATCFSRTASPGFRIFCGRACASDWARTAAAATIAPAYSKKCGWRRCCKRSIDWMRRPFAPKTRGAWARPPAANCCASLWGGLRQDTKRTSWA